MPVMMLRRPARSKNSAPENNDATAIAVAPAVTHSAIPFKDPFAFRLFISCPAKAG